MHDWAEYVRQRLSLGHCRPEAEAQIIEELADQLAEAYKEALLSGLRPEDAFAAAEQHVHWRTLSDDLQDCLRLPRDARLTPERLDANGKSGFSLGLVTDKIQTDVRQAFRALAKNPAFTIVAVMTLALSIGANTAIFTITNALLLRSLPYQNPDELVLVSAAPSNDRGEAGYLSLPFFETLRDRAKSFSGVAAVTGETFSLTGHGDPEQIYGARTSWNFFDLIGVTPIAGRSFTRDERNGTGSPAVLISYELWQRLFGGDRAAIGKSLTLETRDYRIIGVLPPEFQFSLVGTHVNIWAPSLLEMSLATPARVAAGGRYFQVIGRLAPGVSKQRAKEESQAILGQYGREHPKNFDATIGLIMQIGKLQDRMVADVKPAIVILSAAVGFVLLIACANIANLLLSRALARRKEFAVRRALGGSRAALIRQVMTESVLIAFISGGFGIAIGAAGTRLLATFGQSTLPGTANVTMDLPVLVFTLVISMAAGVLFGLAPALQVSKPDLNTMLRDGGRGIGRYRRRNGARGVLVVAQVALSTILLIGSGLLIRSFVRLRSVSPGFEARNLLTMQISLRKFTDRQSVAFSKSVLQRVGALPGVTATAISTALPPTVTHETPVLAEGHPAVAMGKRPIVNMEQTSPDYAKVLGVPLIAGRMFADHDDARAPKVVMVNEAFVRRFWSNENPIGKRIWIGNSNPLDVVGVLGDFRNTSLAEAPAPEVFLPFPQLPWSFLYLSVRTSVEPHSLISAVRREIGAVDRDQPVVEIHTGKELLEVSEGPTRFMMFLLTVFSATAFVLAVIGIYGVIAYMVGRRTQELGIRMALGAARSDVLRLILGNGLALTGWGIALGLAGSFAVTRLMRGMLYETSASDPLTLIGSAALFVLVATIASYVPARRAVRIDPTMALRAE